jgi:hypothetical protein
MEICTPSHLAKTDEKTREHFLTFNLKDYFCIPSHIKNLTAQGAFDQVVNYSSMKNKKTKKKNHLFVFIFFNWFNV